jgi:hypothetical protein
MFSPRDGSLALSQGPVPDVYFLAIVLVFGGLAGLAGEGRYLVRCMSRQ